LFNVSYITYSNLQPDSETQLLTVQFEWNGVLKSVSSTLIGVSPEFEIALYTLCFYMGGEENHIQLGPYPVNIKCYRLGDKIGSAFPVAECWITGGRIQLISCIVLRECIPRNSRDGKNKSTKCLGVYNYCLWWKPLFLQDLLIWSNETVRSLSWYIMAFLSVLLMYLLLWSDYWQRLPLCIHLLMSPKMHHSLFSALQVGKSWSLEWIFADLSFYVFFLASCVVFNIWGIWFLWCL